VRRVSGDDHCSCLKLGLDHVGTRARVEIIV
jgi:hypothetical protein